jgi:hypothetical protein
MASALGSRMAYDKAKEAINRAGFSGGQAVLSQGFLRLEVALSTTKTLYQFSILQNDTTNTATNTEVRLQLQDAFYVSGMGLYFAKPSSSTDTSFQLCTYPNASIFSTANTASSLYNWYNSSLSLTCNNRQIVPNYPLYAHYDVPQQQTTANADYTTSAINYKDQQKGTFSAVAPIEPGWVLVGSKNNVLQVTLPQSMTAVETNSRAVIIFYGHLAQNVTPVR